MRENRAKQELIETLLHLYDVEANSYVKQGYGVSPHALFTSLKKFNKVAQESKAIFTEISFPDLTYELPPDSNKEESKITHESFLLSIKVLINKLSPEYNQLLDYKRMREEFESNYKRKKNALPPEILEIPDKLNNINGIDNVIVTFIKESIKAYSSNCILSAAFMLGAASEKAIYLLIECYAESINDETNKNKFKGRIAKNRIVTAKWEEFKKSYDSCKSKPTNPLLSQDLDTIIGSIFHFCRITRNSIGHPEIVPDLANGTVLANIGNFVEYVNRIYLLMEHFKNNKVDV